MRDTTPTEHLRHTSTFANLAISPRSMLPSHGHIAQTHRSTSPSWSPRRARPTTWIERDVATRPSFPIPHTMTPPTAASSDNDDNTQRQATCAKMHSATYRAKHRDVLREKNRQWKLANKERVAVQKAAYRAKHRHKIRAHDRDIYQQKKRAKLLGKDMPTASTALESTDRSFDIVTFDASTPPMRTLETLSNSRLRHARPSFVALGIMLRSNHDHSTTPTVVPSHVAAERSALSAADAGAGTSFGPATAATGASFTRLLHPTSTPQGDDDPSFAATPVGTPPLSGVNCIVPGSRQCTSGPVIEQAGAATNGMANGSLLRCTSSAKKPRQRNLEKQAEYDRSYRRRHKAELAVKSRMYYHTNKAKVMEYKTRNRDKVAAAVRDWKQRNKVHVQAQRKAYRERNLERIREHDRAIYRAKKNGAVVSSTAQESDDDVSTSKDTQTSLVLL